jgi:hypothetical protein
LENIRGEFIHVYGFFHVQFFGFSFSFHPSKLEGFTSSAIFGTIVGMLLGRNWLQIASNLLQKYQTSAKIPHGSHGMSSFACSRLVPVLFPGMWTFGAENLEASSISSLRLGPTRGQAFATRLQL